MAEERKVPRILGWSLLLLIVAAAVVPLTASAAVKIPYPQHKAEFYLEVNADGPFLSFGQNDTTGGTNIPRYQLSDLVNSPADGALDTVDFFTWGSLGRTPPTATFALTGPLPRTYWLNLSTTIQGQLYWTSTLKETQVNGPYGVQYDRAVVRVELFQGNERVGGQDAVASWGNSVGNDIPVWDRNNLWYTINYAFHPEVTSLRQGQPLSAKITPLWHLSDFAIGTHAPRQSHFNVTYFEFDPLEGTAFVSDHNLVLGGGLNETGDAMTPPLPGGLSPQTGAATIVLPALGFFALRRRTGSSVLAVLLVVLLLGMGLSGCMGPASTPKSFSPPTSSDKSKAVADVGYVYVQALDRQGLGKIQGLVTDQRLGFPIRACNILLAGAGQELLTDDTGTYEFAELQAGDKYHLYFEASEHDEFDTPVTVKRGYIAYVNVSLVSRVVGTDEGQHQHNPWGDRTSIKLTENPLSFMPESTADVDLPTAGWWCTPAVKELEGLDSCASDIPFPVDTPVPAGAVRLEVKLTWSSSTTGARELALRAYPPSAWSEYTAWEFVARPSETPFNIVFFPNEADASHQTFTNWRLEVVAPANHYYHATQHLDYRSPLLLTGDAIEYEITAHKGVLPYEPGHKKFWGNKTQIQFYRENMIDSGTGSSTSALRDYPNFACLDESVSNGGQGTNYPRSSCWALAEANTYTYPNTKPFFVPPGSKEITGTFSWEPKQGAAPPHEWKLKFKPSNAPKYSHDLHDVEVTADNSAEGSINFRISLQGTEPETNQKREDWTDSVYLAKSNWVFYVDDGEDPVQGTSYGTSGATGVKWFLTLTVYKDPAYDETPPPPST